MPQLPFADEHKAAGSFAQYERLKFDRDEKKRILCLEDPTFAWVHELRAPKIVNGKAEQQEVKRKDGSKYTDYVYDFISRPICLGDFGTLQEKGVDPKNCPACTAASAGSEVAPPKRRFAMAVIVYATKPNSFELREPFSCECVVWSFTDRAYNKLVDLVTEWGENGKIRNHDLNLGPCVSKEFQSFEINVASTAAWLKDEDRKKHVLATYQQNKPADLEGACGRKVEKAWMLNDLEKIADRWAIANGTNVAAAGPGLNEGLNELLGENKGSQPQTEAPSPQPVELKMDDLFGNEPPAPASDKPKPDGKTMDFDTLLDSLG